MSLVILNVEIENFINKEKDDLKRNFVGVFPSNSINHFVSLHKLMKEKNATYPYIKMNTDRSDKKGTHYWSFLDFHPLKQIFFFYIFILLLLLLQNIHYTRQ